MPMTPSGHSEISHSAPRVSALEAPGSLAHPQPAAARGQSLILPRCIFAAGRQSFEAVALADLNATEAKRNLFDTLPLEDNGWDYQTAKIRLIGHADTGAKLYLLTRG